MDCVAAPSFIRNIVPSRHQLKQIIVPKSFVKDNPTIFSNCIYVILQVSSGHEYKVDVQMKEGSIVFRGGWKDFAEHYDLDDGYFLVFYYRGSSRFRVGIADTSNCEIDYTGPFHCQCVRDNEEKGEDEESDYDDDDNDDDDEDYTAIALNKGKETVSLALEKAEMRMCKGRSFTVVMNKSYISRDYRMWVPKSFWKKIPEESEYEGEAESGFGGRMESTVEGEIGWWEQYEVRSRLEGLREGERLGCGRRLQVRAH